MATSRSPRAKKAAADAPAPTVPGAPPYGSSTEHLWDELARIDQLARAQTARWRLTIAAGKPQHLWGMIHVSDAEVDAFLQSPFLPSDQIAPELEAAMADYWNKAVELADAIRSRVASTPPGVELRVVRVQELFGLSDAEKDAVLLALLPELDIRYRRLFGYLQDDASRAYVSVELAAQMLRPVLAQSQGRFLFHAAGPLQRSQLISTVRSGQTAEEPLPMRAIVVDDRIAGYLLGSDAPDARLTEIIAEENTAGAENDVKSDPQLAQRLQDLASWWKERRGGIQGATVLLRGPYGSGRLAAARAVSGWSDTSLLTADVEAALRAPIGWELAVDLAFREARLRQAALFWRGCDVLLAPARGEAPGTHRWEYLTAAAEGFPGLCFLASQAGWEPAGQFRTTPFFRIDFAVPTYGMRLELWRKHMPPSEAFAKPRPDLTALAEALANGFQLTEGQMLDAIATARSLGVRRSPQAPELVADDLYEGCRRQSSRRLMAFARRLEPRTHLTFDDLILPSANRRQLEEVRARIRRRSRLYSGFGFERRLTLGKGLIVLFTGSSGTGKTMATELLAREQGVDLYKVDLSAVVSKWVGETEQNLNLVFAEAEDANAIIFFDEADALFGKRGEVKDARDRWANIEVNYLLQRVEEYAGVVILASNLRQNIDEAFMRRIHVMVEFPAPDADGRFRIWRGMFPAGVGRPKDEEIRVLSDRFRLPGGSIRNIVLDAAFRAINEGKPDELSVSQFHLVLAAAREYQKLGKPITKGEFGEEFYSWVEQEIL